MDAQPETIGAPDAAPPPRIALLVPYAGADELRPVARLPVARLRNRARRQLDRLRGGYHFSTYADRHDSNRGDIAVRLATRELLEGALGPVRFAETGWDRVGQHGPGLLADPPDMLVIGGGGYFYLHEGGRLDPRLARDLDLFGALPCPVVALGVGVNRLLEPGGAEAGPPDAAARATLAALLRRLDITTVRDEQGRRLLEDILPGRAATVADPALFLRPAPVPDLPARRQGVLHVGLNVAFHGPESSRVLPARVALVAAAAHALAAREKTRFFYFVHADPERLVPRLLRRAGIAVTVVDAPPAAMLPWYGLLDVHLCQMLHSAILATNAGVPTLSLGYDVKNAAFHELLGMERFCLPSERTDATAAIAALAELVADRQQLAAAIARRRAALRREMDATLERLAALLPARSRPRSA